MPSRSRKVDAQQLTPKQLRFVQEYLIDLDAKGAAIRAGYSRAAAKQTGHKLKQVPAVQRAIELGQQAKARQLKMSADETIERVTNVGRGNIVQVLTRMGRRGALADRLAKLPPELQDAISEVRFGRGVTVIKMHQKMHALDLMAKRHGLLVERHQVEVNATARVVEFALPANGRRPAKG